MRLPWYLGPRCRKLIAHLRRAGSEKDYTRRRDSYQCIPAFAATKHFKHACAPATFSNDLVASQRERRSIEDVPLRHEAVRPT